MPYQVLARKWRPRNLQTLIGQVHIKRTLTNALNAQRLHHAYLLTGTHGVGKTSIARIIAKSLNCERGISAEPCGVCTTCVEIDEGRFMDLIEIDAASRTKVEDTRGLLENVQYLPTRGRFKVYLIDEVHMLSDHSFNALLKTLEEPPPHVKFLLATTDPDRLPVTVLSRCLQFHLKNLLSEEIAAHLEFILTQENIPYEKEALNLIAQAAAGSVRDALSILDQAINYCQGNIVLSETQQLLGTLSPVLLWELLEALVSGQANSILACIQQLALQAVDFSAALKELLSLLHHIALVQAVPSMSEEASVLAFSKRLSPEEVQLYYQIALMGQRDLPLAPSPKQGFEMVLLRMLAFQPVSAEIPPRPPFSKRGISSEIPTSLPFSKGGISSDSKEGAIDSPLRRRGVGGDFSVEAEYAAFFPQLNLAGLSQTLVSHCTLKELTDTHAQLLLDPKHATLLNPKLEERISLAFSQHFGRTMKVNITVGSENMDTPARRQSQNQTQQHQAAVEALTQMPVVQSLVKHFDAKLVPESVEVDK